MPEKTILVRSARLADAPFVAKVVLMALHYDESHPLYGIFRELAARTDAQYS